MLFITVLFNTQSHFHSLAASQILLTLFILYSTFLFTFPLMIVKLSKFLNSPLSLAVHLHTQRKNRYWFTLFLFSFIIFKPTLFICFAYISAYHAMFFFYVPIRAQYEHKSRLLDTLSVSTLLHSSITINKMTFKSGHFWPESAFTVKIFLFVYSHVPPKRFSNNPDDYLISFHITSICTLSKSSQNSQKSYRH